MTKRKRKFLFIKKPQTARPQTGNKRWVKQWLYIYWNIPCFWTVKIGVTGTYLNRWKEVNNDKGNWGFDIPLYPLIPLPVYGAYNIEQFNKKMWAKILSSGARVNYFTGTGKTERFYFYAAIPALILALLSILIEWGFKIGLVVSIIFFIHNLPS